MIISYLIGITGIIALMIIWLVIQREWGKTFYDHIKDEDVLADRSNCGNCGCTNYCENKSRK